METLSSEAAATLSQGSTVPYLPPWPADSDDLELDEQTPRSKRPRVALACQRCKTRKQKCDGCHPCSKCRTSSVPCEYVVPRKPMPFGKNQYIKSLERRVAELETILATRGIAEPSDDHWRGPFPAVDTLVHADAGQSEGQSSSSHDQEFGDPDESVLDWQDGVDSVVGVLRSLSLDVNGSGYMGASSHVALGKLFNFLNRSRRPSSQRHRDVQPDLSATPSLAPSADVQQPIEFADVPANVADRLFGGYLKHIATRLPVIHSVWARNLHNRRHSIDNVFEATILHLIYATAGRFIETTGETGPFNAKRHYASAMKQLDTILMHHDLRTVQALMLMAAYCLRDPVGLGAWTYCRTALLVAIDHGLHRRTKAMAQPSMKNELRKRLFWACYAFDRQISIPMGRPFGISDRDIDLDLPLDIDEDTEEDDLSRMNVLVGSQTKSTTLTSFIMVVKLRQIESDIQQTIYRVDKNLVIEDAIIDEFLARLKQWKEIIPQDTRHFVDIGDVPFDGYDCYLVYYYKCQRLLLYPLISDRAVAPRFLQDCARACAGICGTYKRLHQSLAVGYSIMALQTVFVAGKPSPPSRACSATGLTFQAGLTLAYCLWISPEEIHNITTSNGINDCSIVLFVIAERVPSTKKYRNAFEVIRQKVVDQISCASDRQPREAITGLSTELARSASDFELNKPFEVDNGSFELFSQIITDITGEDFVGGMARLEADACDPGLFNFDGMFGLPESNFELPEFDEHNFVDDSVLSA